jgi:hypothetical protein
VDKTMLIEGLVLTDGTPLHEGWLLIKEIALSDGTVLVEGLVLTDGITMSDRWQAAH